MYNVYDTSALLAQDITAVENIYIPHLVFRELEDIKNSNTKNEEVKARARELVRNFIANKYPIMTNSVTKKAIEKTIKKYDLPDNNDGHILAEAICLDLEGNIVKFHTADSLLYLFAKRTGQMLVEYVSPEEVKKEPWSGWRDFYPTEQQMTELYSNPEINTLNAITNEYCKIHENGELKDVLRWDGQRYLPLKYKDMKNPYTQETLKPRNLEQKMAFNLLQNQDIKVKALVSAWGGGKTLMALTYALEQVAKGNYQKIIFIRNNIIVSSTNDIGYLPGTVQEKCKIWGMCMASHVGGTDMLDQLLEDGTIEIFPISHIRGLSIKSSIVLADESENLTAKHITLLMSRIEEDSEIIFCGDMAQVDFRQGAKHSGMNHMIESLEGDKLFGVVKLVKSERGPVPRLCDKIIPPK